MVRKKLYYGAAYYPELWDERIIDEDIWYMNKIGINVVRIGEFAWAKMEPEEGKVDIAFFVEIINRLYENGIQTIMCTPTPAPPIWISHNHPERMIKDENGIIMSHGARQHVCSNNYYFRERSRIIVEAIAKAVENLPGVMAWQLDNEFKCHVGECMCETCKLLWHEWLEERYGKIENLNNAWGTMIWSEYYQSFDQVPQPIKTTFIHNSSLSTMHRIFSREKITEFAEEQANIIRKYSDAPITHNITIGFKLDNESLFKNLDFAALDDYACSEDYNRMLLSYDLMRNVKKDRGFWVMETSTSHNGCLEGSRKTHPNGYLKVEALAAYSKGAEGFLYWLWRQQRAGCEQLHGAILSSWGDPMVGNMNVIDTKVMLDKLEPILLSTRPCQPELAHTFSDRANVFFLTEPLGMYEDDSKKYEQVHYYKYIENWNRMLLDTGICNDWIFEGECLEGYKMLVTPFVPYISNEFLNRVKSFVENGGIWIAGPLTGWRTGEHTVHENAALGDIEAFAGVKTVYHYQMSNSGAVGRAFGMKAELSHLSAVFELRGTSAIGVIEGGVTPGLAFITEHKVGKGKVVMVGSMPKGSEGTEMLQNMITYYADETGISHSTDVSPGTIVVQREGNGLKYWFIINMDGKGGSVSIASKGTDVLENECIAPGRVNIEGFAYRVVKFEM